MSEVSVEMSWQQELALGLKGFVSEQREGEKSKADSPPPGYSSDVGEGYSIEPKRRAH